MRRAWLHAVLLALGLYGAPGLCAARVPTRLVYSRTPEASACPDEDALAAAVASRLGYEPFSPWGDQTILATITRQGGALVGRAELIDHDGIAQGSREVRVARPECGELLLALALAISITLDPLHVDAPAAEPKALEPEAQQVAKPESESDPEPEPVLAPPPPKPVDVSTRPSRERSPFTWHASAAALGMWKPTPASALGGRLGIALRHDAWSLGVEAWSVLPTTRESASGGDVRVRLTALGLVPCVRLWRVLSGCALATVGALRAEGRGVDVTRTETVAYASAGLRALALFPLGTRFDLLANADLAASLIRPRFQLDSQDVWRPGLLVASLGLGASLRFF